MFNVGDVTMVNPMVYDRLHPGVHKSPIQIVEIINDDSIKGQVLDGYFMGSVVHWKNNYLVPLTTSLDKEIYNLRTMGYRNG